MDVFAMAPLFLLLLPGLDSVFFGHSLVPQSVMRKTTPYWVIDVTFYARFIKTLASHPIVKKRGGFSAPIFTTKTIKSNSLELFLMAASYALQMSQMHCK
jgi:hypothetical protein